MEKLFTLLRRNLKQWWNQLKKLSTQTHFCKVCFNEIKINSFHHLLNNVDICSKCLLSLKPIFKTFKIDEYKALSLYHYDESTKSKIFQLKGCGDIELAQIFVKPYGLELNARFHDYTLVCLPSFEGDNQKRGFNHVEEMFNCLKLKKCDCLRKTEHYKQSDQSYKKRHEVSKYIALKENIDLANKKILLVDDICTTGSSLRAALNLIEKCHPKMINILVVSKRDFSKEEAKEMSNYIDVLN